MANQLVNLRGSNPGQNRQTDAIARVVDELALQVQATPIGGAAPPAWVRPQLLNGFVDAGAPYNVASYHVDALGYVHLGGVVATAAGTPAWTAVFQLPVAARPLYQRLIPAIDPVGPLAVLAVSADGYVSAVSILGPGSGLVLDGLSFLAGA